MVQSIASADVNNFPEQKSGIRNMGKLENKSKKEVKV